MVRRPQKQMIIIIFSADDVIFMLKIRNENGREKKIQSSQVHATVLFPYSPKTGNFWFSDLIRVYSKAMVYRKTNWLLYGTFISNFNRVCIWNPGCRKPTSRVDYGHIQSKFEACKPFGAQTDASKFLGGSCAF